MVFAYRAELRWGGVRVHYTSLLPGGATSLRSTPEPEASGNTVTWHVPRFGLEARWESLDPPFRTELGRHVDWHCLAPRARADVRIGTRSISGLGYVEHLTLTVPPWRLPIQELRWGRLLDGSSSVVWIDWCGPEPHKVTLRNGAPGDAEMPVLTPGRVLRDGALGSTILQRIPALARTLPGRVLAIHETKWLTRSGDGWAIHEVVRWP